MRKRFLFILLLLPIGLMAQIDHEDILSVEYGGIWQNDEYLSPLLYEGRYIGIANQWNQSFRRDSSWSHTADLRFTGARLYNKRKYNIYYSLGLQTDWNAVYNFRQMLGVRGLNIYIGPSIDLDFMGRYHYSNYNKPVSLDFAIVLGARAGLSYSFAAKKTSYRVSYDIQTSLLGAMFVPDFWQSYYEISESLKGTIVCANVANRQLLRHQLSLDMQFRHSAWRVAVRHEYLQYKAHDLFFSREEVSLVVSTIFHFSSKIKVFL